MTRGLVFCSGCFVIVLATEQDFAFRINDLHAVPVVPVILGGMVGQCVFYGSIERLGKCTKNHSDYPYPIFHPEQNTFYLLYIV